MAASSGVSATETAVQRDGAVTCSAPAATAIVTGSASCRFAESCATRPLPEFADAEIGNAAVSRESIGAQASVEMGAVSAALSAGDSDSLSSAFGSMNEDVA